MNVFFYETPVGTITLAEREEALTHLEFGKRAFEAEIAETPFLKNVGEQLKAYFAGRLKDFSVSLAPEGTAFQKKVWEALRRIPYGETVSYGEIAAEAGNPKACRAVGMANNRNPISIIVPCHRVIGADGSLVGYGGGLDIKRRLLALEDRYKNEPGRFSF